MTTPGRPTARSWHSPPNPSQTSPGPRTPTSGPSPPTGGELKNLTAANKGADAQPAYSPDGQWLAFVSQARAGFESDQWVLKLENRQSGPVTELDQIARPAGSVVCRDD